ncbi:hypothetical protein BT63DRAFT_423998 [Microthyrium microscopicum]|uniref:Mid2 domain-containing protein n=1 Tax=Microthyrium microscopicum TaxID=703497 RepID=A0A6A6UCQ7_9PEZI|nr:hypothetical protein BT63DRAFT_423998 [Microthyrium microscopicum]
MANSLLLASALAVFSFSHTALAATPSLQNRAATTTAASSFPTITDTENTGALDTSSSNGVVAGAEGGSSGVFEVSTGAIVGIAIGVAVVVIAFITLWALWFIAQRRDWAYRDTLKYASRRITRRAAVPPTPRTPGRTPGFPPTAPRKAAYRNTNVSYDADMERGTAVPKKSAKPNKSAMKPFPGWLEEDDEKGMVR